MASVVVMPSRVGVAGYEIRAQIRALGQQERPALEQPAIVVHVPIMGAALRSRCTAWVLASALGIDTVLKQDGGGLGVG